jgi:hypothetical protein
MREQRGRRQAFGRRMCTGEGRRASPPALPQRVIVTSERPARESARAKEKCPPVVSDGHCSFLDFAQFRAALQRYLVGTFGVIFASLSERF